MRDDHLTSQLTRARRSRQRRLLLGAVVVVSAVLAAAGVAMLVYNPPPATDGASDEASQGFAATSGDSAAADCHAATGRGCEREDFTAALRRFTLEAGPALAGVSLAAWDPAGAARIDALKEQAIAAFEEGRYGAALASVQQALTAADEALARADDLFRESMDGARRAFDDGDAELARQASDQALVIAPDSDEARALDARIEVLPQVTAALEAARVASVENRPEAQQRHLREALALDPARTQLRAQLSALERASTASTYAAAVRRAESALAQGELERAQQAVAQARRTDNSKDLSYLQTRIDAALAERRLSQALSRARAARGRDDWRDAREAYVAALAVDDTNAESVAGVGEADTVLRGLERLRPYLADPLRLGTDRVQSSARGVVVEYAPHRHLSPGLDTRLAQLEWYLEQVQEPVRVTLLSDGLTEMRVRQVGVVGKHERATIQLTPGRYELEGRRTGFRSKLVPLEVGFEVDAMEVRVVCDEPAA